MACVCLRPRSLEVWLTACERGKESLLSFGMLVPTSLLACCQYECSGVHVNIAPNDAMAF